jgi:hypothetical protein
MWKQLLYKWFGLIAPSCLTCEVLRDQLEKSEAERRDLLARLLEVGKPESVVHESSEPIAIKPQYVPWRVRQQMLESEDRKQAQLLRDKNKEIEESRIQELEKELLEVKQ